jgi:hypothetical protein
MAKILFPNSLSSILNKEKDNNIKLIKILKIVNAWTLFLVSWDLKNSVNPHPDNTETEKMPKNINLEGLRKAYSLVNFNKKTYIGL